MSQHHVARSWRTRPTRGALSRTPVPCDDAEMQLMTSEVLRYAAFTTIPDGGNPAGVVLDATQLADARM
jgi:hypothetical protein